MQGKWEGGFGGHDQMELPRTWLCTRHKGKSVQNGAGQESSEQTSQKARFTAQLRRTGRGFRQWAERLDWN